MTYLMSFLFALETVAQEDFVLINGGKWATRNVETPGTFAKNPESSVFQQWIIHPLCCRIKYRILRKIINAKKLCVFAHFATLRLTLKAQAHSFTLTRSRKVHKDAKKFSDFPKRSNIRIGI